LVYINFFVLNKDFKYSYTAGLEMNFVITTHSHGVVSGYCNLDSSSIGEYVFATEHLCSLLRNIAEDHIMQGSILRIEDMCDAGYRQGKMVPVVVLHNSIAIGEYRISSKQFGTFALYLTKGINGKQTEMLEQTLDSINCSKNPFYRAAQEMLRSLEK
jgi:hypothetical protein